MATKYLLPCDCGQSIPIEPGQAGQQIVCACGNTVEAPSMRSIRNLEPQVDASDDQAKGSWNASAGLVFVCGAVLILVGITAIGFSYFSRMLLQRNLPVRSQAGIDQWLAEIDTASPDQLVDVWNDALQNEFSDAEDSPWQQFRRESRKYDIALWVGIGAAVLGLGLASGSTLLRTRPAAGSG